MTNKDTLAQLAAQAEARGADLPTLRALIEEASELGAQRALTQLGLADEKAPKTCPNCANYCRPGAMPKRRRARR